MSLSRRTRKRLFILAVIGAAGAAGVFTLKSVNKTQAAKTLETKRQSGFEAFEAENFGRAFEDLQFVYWGTNEPDRTSELVLSLATARSHVPAENGTHVLRAIELAQEAARMSPDALEPQELMMRMYSRIRFYTELREVAERVLTKDPAHRQALERRVEALNGLGQTDESITAAQALVEAHPDDLEAHSLYVQIQLLHNSRPEEALEYARDLANENEDKIRAHLIHAAAALTLGDRREGSDAARKAAALPLEDNEQLGALLFVLDSATADDPSLAQVADELLRARIDDPEHGDQAALIAAERSWRSGRISDVPELLARVVRTPDDAPTDALGWAGVSGHPDAVAFAEELRSRPQRDAKVWAALIDSSLAVSEGDLDSALSHAKDADEFTPGEFEFRGAADEAVQFILASIEREMGLMRSAQVRLTDLSRNPSWRVSRLALAQLHLDTGRPDLAAGVLARDAVLTRTRAGAVAYVRAMVQGAETNVPGAPTPAQVRQAIGQIDQQLPEETLLPYRLRAELLAGDTEAASATVDRIEALGDGIDAGALLVAARRAPEPLSSRLYEIVGTESGAAVAIARAFDNRNSMPLEEALAQVDERISQTTDEATKLGLRVARIEMLDRARHPDTLSDLKELSDSHSEAPSAQLAVLQSETAWADESLVSIAVDRLRAITGEQDPSWPVFDARRLLAFGDGQRDLADAIQLLNRVLVRSPDDESALLLLAEAWGELGDNERRLDTLGRAWEAGGSPGRILPPLITGLRQAGRLTDAERRLGEFMSLGDLDAPTSRRRASLLELFGRWDDALRERQTLAERGGAGDLHALALLTARTGDSDEASDLFAALAQREDATPDQIFNAALFEAGRSGSSSGLAVLSALDGVEDEGTLTRRRADLLARTGDAPTAREIVESRLSAAPDDHETRRWLVRHWISQSEIEQARRVLDEAPASAAESEALSAMGSLLDRAGTGGEGLMAALATMAADDTDSPGMSALAAALEFRATQPNQEDRFLQMLEELTADSPAFYPGWASYVGLLSDRGESGRAITAARTAMRLLPADGRPARDVAVLLAASGRYTEARAAAEQWRQRSLADALEPDVFLARLDIDEGQPQRAVRTLRPWIDRGAISREDVLRVWSMALAANGQTEDAIAAVNAGTVDSTTARELKISVGLSLAAQPDLALAWLDELEAMPSDLVLANAYLMLAERSGDQRALNAVVRTVGDPEQADDPVRAWLLIGGASVAGGDTEEAANAFRKALAIDAENAEAVLALARLGEDNVEDDLRAVIARGAEPGSVNPGAAVDARSQLAILLARRGSTDEAMSLVRELEGSGSRTMVARLEVLFRAGENTSDLLRDATQPMLLQQLASLTQRFDAEGRVEDTVSLYRAVLSLLPDNPAIQNNLAYALVRTSEPRSQAANEAALLSGQAVRLARASGANPNMLGAFLHTHGASLALSGDQQGAASAFEESLELNPDSVTSKVGLAEIIAQQGDAARARTLLDEALSADDIDDDLRQRARVALRSIED